MTNRVKILVVDDDPWLLDLLIETLQAIGYDAVGAPGADQALELLSDSPFHLVVTDIMMPGTDGFALARKIREQYPGLPVIFITGVFTSQILKLDEAEKFLPKPFRIGQLEDLIKSTLAAKDSDIAKDFVLVVDDEDSFRLMLMETLKLSGYRVLGAASGEEALELLGTESVSAVIADLKMPDIDGLELARRIKNQRPELPVILITAYLSGSESEFSSDVIDAFLIKPFKIESITGLLESLRDRINQPSR